jgi:hypothetical protein
MQGEKLLGNLGGIFSRKWKPERTRAITGPVLTRGILPPIKFIDLVVGTI